MGASPQSVVCVTQVEVSGSNLSILVYLPAVSHTSPPDQTKFKILAAHYPTSPPFPKPLAFMRICRTTSADPTVLLGSSSPLAALTAWNFEWL